MNLGLFVDVRQLDTGRSCADHTSATLEHLVEAERLGLDAVWLTEHHGFADGYLAQPLVLAAAIAARTSRVRLGTAVLLAPLRHPRHIAEEAALVDVISGGRLELGLGAGYAPREFGAFGADFARRYDTTDATALEVARLLSEGDVFPRPVQRPLPLWLGYRGPRGARRAGRAGVGLLSIDRALYQPYVEGLEEGGHDPAGARMGGVVDIVVADDPPAAIRRLLPHWLHQMNTYRAIMRGPDGNAPPPLSVETAEAALMRTGRLGSLEALSVDDTVARVRAAVDGLPVAHVYSWLSVCDMPADLLERHVELWCGPVRRALAGPSPVRS